MKKANKVITACLCGTLLMGAVGCGAKSEANMVADASYNYNTKGETASYDSSMEQAGIADNMGGTLTEEELIEVYAEDNRKTIKTATLNLQTLEFDQFLTALQEQVKAVGAYIEYSYESGNNRYYNASRNAEYRIRVPQSNLQTFLDGMGGIATVVSKNEQEQDVTLAYVDTESRIKTLQIEQERLLALLEKAENLESIIALEQRLGEVRYQIESYTSQLRTYDNKITYSTVSIYVSEVLRVTAQEPKTVWERISNGWDNTMYNIKTGAQDWFVWVIVSAPYLIFWAVVLVVVVVIINKQRKRRKSKKQQDSVVTEEVKKEHDTKMDD